MAENGQTPFIEEDLPILPKFTKDMKESLKAYEEVDGKCISKLNGSKNSRNEESYGKLPSEQVNGKASSEQVNGKASSEQVNGKAGTNHAQILTEQVMVPPGANGKPIVDGSVIQARQPTAFFPLGKRTHLSSARNADEYRMDYPNRGRCLIFNHSRFSPVLNMPTRHGTNTDRDNLKILFSQLGFEVDVCNDFSLKEVVEKIHTYAYEIDHSQNDCFVMFFLTHGEDGLLFTRDSTIDVDKIFKDFTADNCPSLAGKPKMFFIQACRGDGVETSVSLYGPDDQTDSGGLTRYSIPSNADFLTCYSTVNDHYSWRNTINGAWFIQSIIHVFRQEADTEDVLSMMTNVNRHMILNFTSNISSNSMMHNRKQTANICSTLMRKVYLKPKP